MIARIGLGIRSDFVGTREKAKEQALESEFRRTFPTLEFPEWKYSLLYDEICWFHARFQAL